MNWAGWVAVAFAAWGLVCYGLGHVVGYDRALRRERRDARRYLARARPPVGLPDPGDPARRYGLAAAGLLVVLAAVHPVHDPIVVTATTASFTFTHQGPAVVRMHVNLRPDTSPGGGPSVNRTFKIPASSPRRQTLTIPLPPPRAGMCFVQVDVTFPGGKRTWRGPIPGCVHPTPTPHPSPHPSPPPSHPPLPDTGASLLWPLGVGLGLLTAGALLLRRRA